MSSFGAVPLDLAAARADFVVSSANKCLQGVPGFSFVVARRAALEACKGRARSLSLDLHAQWAGLEAPAGQFRFTPPTHALLAFAEALREFEAEGGVVARGARYAENRRVLREGMAALGFEEFLAPEHQSYIITSYRRAMSPGVFLGGGGVQQRGWRPAARGKSAPNQTLRFSVARCCRNAGAGVQRHTTPSLRLADARRPRLSLPPPQRFPKDPSFDFPKFYGTLADRGFYIYPGKVSKGSI
jgi:hypothetical protein